RDAQALLMKRKRGAVVLIGIIVLAGGLLAGVSQASSATTTVSGSPTGGSGAVLVDLKSVSHSDDAQNIVWSFHTGNTVTAASFDHVQWDLDLSNPPNGRATDPEDACVFMAAAGTKL